MYKMSKLLLKVLNLLIVIVANMVLTVKDTMAFWPQWNSFNPQVQSILFYVLLLSSSKDYLMTYIHAVN